LIPDILERCCREIPSTLGAAVLDVSTGSVVGLTSRDESLDLVTIAPTLSDVVRRHISAMEALGGQTAGTEDLIFSTPRGALIVHRFGPALDRSYAIVLFAGRLANPGMARLVLATYEARLLEGIR
jgi:hypothetical protein